MGQRTIAEKISCTGIGLHSGEPVQLTLEPARVNTGVVFVRSDLSRPVEISACPANVTSTRFATTLGRENATVGTVEHLLSALYASGVDNVRASVAGSEVPVMDGSAASFVGLVQKAGLYEQGEPRRRLVIRRTVEVGDGDRRIRISPARGFRVSYGINYSHPAIGIQSIKDFALDRDCFEAEICRARTFGFLHEVEELWRLGFAQGGSLENTVVLDRERVLNRDGLRWKDEFVRHKVLDLVGDFALLGVAIDGHVEAECAGHELHQTLIRELIETPSSWEIAGADPSTDYETGGSHWPYPVSYST